MMKNRPVITIALLLFLSACTPVSEEYKFAKEIEQSLFNDIITPWYPACLDTVYGGYISTMEANWTPLPDQSEKSLVYEARHLWTLSFLAVHYPEHKEFLQYARHGFEFIETHMKDHEYGAFYSMVSADGSIKLPENLSKKIYGQAFLISAMARYYAASGDDKALKHARETFSWMEEKVHDKIHGGYLECLNRDGSPELTGLNSNIDASPLIGLKEFNSSLHLLEAFTELYLVWPDSLVKERLTEMYLLFRDTIINPEGHLNLFFYPDWSLVPQDSMNIISNGSAWYTQHITFGHDVETAFLMHEAAHALGLKNDQKMEKLAKKLLDHSLKYGWDSENGGFYYMAYKENGTIRIYDPRKAFWVISEGLNALVLMNSLYPDDSINYYQYSRDTWSYITKYLLDTTYGGWYNYGTDYAPENIVDPKAHNWKANYHDVRSLVLSSQKLKACE